MLNKIISYVNLSPIISNQIILLNMKSPANSENKRFCTVWSMWMKSEPMYCVIGAIQTDFHCRNRLIVFLIMVVDFILTSNFTLNRNWFFSILQSSKGWLDSLLKEWLHSKVPIILPSWLLKFSKVNLHTFSYFILGLIIWEVFKPTDDLLWKLFTWFECVTVQAILH